MNLHDCSVPIFSKPFKIIHLQVCEVSQHNMSSNDLGLLGFVKVPWGPKDKISGFGAQRDTSRNPKILNMRVFGSSHKQIEKSLESKMQQNNSTELSTISCPEMYHENCFMFPISCSCGFPMISLGFFFQLPHNISD